MARVLVDVVHGHYPTSHWLSGMVYQYLFAQRRVGVWRRGSHDRRRPGQRGSWGFTMSYLFHGNKDLKFMYIEYLYDERNPRDAGLSYTPGFVWIIQVALSPGRSNDA